MGEACDRASGATASDARIRNRTANGRRQSLKYDGRLIELEDIECMTTSVLNSIRE